VEENIYYLYIKGLITRIYRELKKLNSPKISEPIKKWAIIFYNKTLPRTKQEPMKTT
jgi:hypothetical protein